MAVIPIGFTSMIGRTVVRTISTHSCKCSGNARSWRMIILMQPRTKFLSTKSSLLKNCICQKMSQGNGLKKSSLTKLIKSPHVSNFQNSIFLIYSCIFELEKICSEFGALGLYLYSSLRNLDFFDLEKKMLEFATARESGPPASREVQP